MSVFFIWEGSSLSLVDTVKMKRWHVSQDNVRGYLLTKLESDKLDTMIKEVSALLRYGEGATSVEILNRYIQAQPDELESFINYLEKGIPKDGNNQILVEQPGQ